MNTPQPTLGLYISWLTSIGGEAKTGVGLDPAVGMVPCVFLFGPPDDRGRRSRVMWDGTDQSEVLARAIVDMLDRRREHRAISSKHPMLSVLGCSRRVVEKPVPTFSPGALGVLSPYASGRGN